MVKLSYLLQLNNQPVISNNHNNNIAESNNLTNANDFNYSVKDHKEEKKKKDPIWKCPIELFSVDDIENNRNLILESLTDPDKKFTLKKSMNNLRDTLKVIGSIYEDFKLDQ